MTKNKSLIYFLHTFYFIIYLVIMKKIVYLLLFFCIFFTWNHSFSNETFQANWLYYSDIDNNWKIDTLEIEFNQNLTWILNLEKLQIHSNTWWLSSYKLDEKNWNIVSSYSFSWNILNLNLIEQDNYLTWLTINNSTTSHLRLKSLLWFWLYSINQDTYTFSTNTSLNNYKNISFKQITSNLNQKWGNEDLNDDIIDDELDNQNQDDILDEDDFIDNQNAWNWEDDELEDNLENNSNNTNSWTTNNQETQNQEENVLNFDTKLILQSPTYFLESDSSETLFNCDSSKTDCKANFSLQIDEWNWFKDISTTKYSCLWDFWIWVNTLQEEKCNPNTILYPIWEFEVNFKVTLKSNPVLFIQKNFLIKNSWYILPVSQNTYVYTSNNNQTNQNINILTPKIEIQSWLNDDLTCKNELCSVNFIYNEKDKNESCLWDFWLWEKTLQEEKCNPTSVKYEKFWEYKISLKVYDRNNSSNYKQSYIIIKNIQPQKEEIIENKKEKIIKDENKVEKLINNYEVATKQNNINYTLKITKALTNPIWWDNLEFIELKNIWDLDIDLDWCLLDDLRDWWSKPFIIKQNTIIKSNQYLKFYKFDTKLNLNNSWYEEVNLFCNNNLIDWLSWDFSTPEWFLITPDIDLNNISKVKKIKNKDNFEIIYKNKTSKNISFQEKNTILEDILNTNLSKEEKKQKLFDMIEKSFSQKISKQKIWIKIYWTTLPNISLIISLKKIDDEFSFLNLFLSKTYASNDIFEVKSDNLWNYQLVLTTPNIWEFEVNTSINFWWENTFDIEKKSSLEIDDDYINYISSISDKKATQKIEENYILPKAIITLQWKITQNKIFSGNKLTCLWVDECSINFDWSESEWKNINYFWDFWNGKTFNKKNPSSYTFTSWTYFVNLTVSDNQNSSKTHFIIEVEWKPKKEPKTSSLSTDLSWTKIISNKSDISLIPTVYADYSNDKDIIFHIYMSLLVFIVFFIWSLVLLKRQKII